MELFLLDRQKFNLLYNCSFYSIEKIAVFERQNVFLGSFILATFVCVFVSCNRHMKGRQKRTRWRARVFSRFTSPSFSRCVHAKLASPQRIAS